MTSLVRRRARQTNVQSQECLRQDGVGDCTDRQMLSCPSHDEALHLVGNAGNGIHQLGPALLESAVVIVRLVVSALLALEEEGDVMAQCQASRSNKQEISLMHHQVSTGGSNLLVIK